MPRLITFPAREPLRFESPTPPFSLHYAKIDFGHLQICSTPFPNKYQPSKSLQSPFTTLPPPTPPTMKAPLHLPFLLFLLIPRSLANTISTFDSTGSDVNAPANMDITSWTEANCAGDEIQNTNIAYDWNFEAESRSYKLSRQLAPGEQLDVSLFFPKPCIPLFIIVLDSAEYFCRLRTCVLTP